MLVLSKTHLEERWGLGGGGGGGGGREQPFAFIAIESFYFSQDGRRKVTFFPFALISFVQGVYCKSEKMGRFYPGRYCEVNEYLVHGESRSTYRE